MKAHRKIVAGLVGGLAGFAGAGDCDWVGLASGAGPAVYGLAVLEDGRVVFGGSISLAGTLGVSRIAMWDGVEWHSIDGGVDGFVRTVLANEGGGFVAGGQFFTAGGQAAGLIAEWDESGWHALGGGLDAGSCRTLLRLSDGDLIAGGSFLQADDLPAWGMARWDGTDWSKMGNNTDAGGVSGWLTPEPSPTMVLDAVEMPNGDIIIGGNFRMADDVEATGIARWDGTSWKPVGGGMNFVVRALLVLPDGDLIAAGPFGLAGGVPCNGLARWDGTSWSAIGDGLNGINQRSPQDLALTPDGKVILSGAFDLVDGVPANNIAIWDPQTDVWSAMGSGMVPRIQTSVFAVDVREDGVVFAGGQFESAGGDSSAWNVAQYACDAVCTADFNGDGLLNFFDVSAFVDAFVAQDPAADWTGDGKFTVFDLIGFVDGFVAGCG